MYTLPKSFGDGWASKNAIDLARIVVAVGNVHPRSLMVAIRNIHSGPETVTLPTVCRALATIRWTQKPPSWALGECEGHGGTPDQENW